MKQQKIERPKVTVGIPTKNRYEFLAHTLHSIAIQTFLPYEIIIVDDSDSLIDIRTMPIYQYILEFIMYKGIKWRLIYGQKRGQHFSHQLIQEAAEGDWIFRIDDDEVAEPNCIKRLVDLIKPDVGAIAPCVLMPNPKPLIAGLENTIDNLDKPNIQWFLFEGTRQAEHLYSCFLYRKGVNDYELTLSTVCHREETLFSYGIKRKGYRLIVNGNSKVWHWRSESGGIRTFTDNSLWEHDEMIFRGVMSMWEKEDNFGKKIIICDTGLGDTILLKSIIPALKKKYSAIKVFTWFKDIFEDDDIEVGDVTDAKLIFGRIDHYNIYHFCLKTNHNGNITEAFKKFYNV